MRFDSKSLLSTIQLTHLEFTCNNISAWLIANPNDAYDLDNFLPVKLLGSGNYGSCYSLLDYPGLVIKVCSDPSDGYPRYIKAVTEAKRKAWMPVVFAHGGAGTGASPFWCVMPEYDNPWGHDACHFLDWVGSDWPLTACREVCQYEAGAQAQDKKSMRRRPKKERRYIRQVRDFLRPMREEGADVYMHAKNALLDNGRWIITDPIAEWHE